MAQHSDTQDLSNSITEHFFRHEYAKMVSVITRYFGVGQMDLAEEIVQDALLEAVKNWEFKGIPENPTAWLYTVAKNKALNALKKQGKQEEHEQDLKQSPEALIETRTPEELFSDEEIADDLLRMMFICCRPELSSDGQVCLILKTLCGLSIDEIASAYLTGPDTINKRLVRARKILREANIEFALPGPEELEDRLTVVLKSIYLVFSEGYNASRGQSPIRYELCMEAIRLTQNLLEDQRFKENRDIHALLALMLLNVSRFEARLNETGIVEMARQDRNLWDEELLQKGLQSLQDSSDTEIVSIYHLMAAISALHNTAPDYESTNWEAILSLYDSLRALDDSPVVLLNRAIALAKVQGNLAAINELQKLASDPAMQKYHLYYATLANLQMEADLDSEAEPNLHKAIQLAGTVLESKLLKSRLEICRAKIE